MYCGNCFCRMVIRYFLHWVQQGVIIFHDVFDNEHEVGGAQIKVEGVYIWPFRQLRMVANRYICWVFGRDLKPLVLFLMMCSC